MPLLLNLNVLLEEVEENDEEEVESEGLLELSLENDEELEPEEDDEEELKELEELLRESLSRRYFLLDPLL